MKISEIQPIELYAVKKKEDVKQASRVLAEAFKDDAHMLWLFGSRENYQKYSQSVFESWVWYGVLYAHVYRTQGYECVSMLKEPGHFGFSVWGMLWSGMIFKSIWYLGFSGCLRMQQYDKAATKHVKEYSGTPDFWYIWQIGVQTNSQGQGLGGKAADAIENKILEQSKGEKAPVYVEAVSNGSEKFFSRRGYKRLGSYDLEYSKKEGGAPVVCMKKILQR